MSKQFAVCGLGNAIVDIFLDVNEEEFESLGFERGTMVLVDEAQQKELMERFQGQRDLRLVSGGSVANSIIGLSQLGGKGAFIGVVGDDRYGLHYVEEFTQLGIGLADPVLVGQTTGTCVAVITPDAERTMRTNLAVSSELAERHVDESLIAKSEWLFIEGYVFANPETGQGAIKKAIEIAKANGTKVAITASDAFIPEVFGDALKSALADANLLFCNGPESLAITGAATTAEAFAQLKDVVPNCVVTDGENGAHVRYFGVECHVPANECEPKDLTGAGDMFAGAFLYGITSGAAPETAGKGANYLCMKVITQVGARLESGAKSYWSEAFVS